MRGSVLHGPRDVRFEALDAPRIGHHRDDPDRHSGKAQRKSVDWMEKVTDQQYRV
jgi:hypothetical protein